MKNQHWLRNVCCLLFIVAIALTGCKKQVAATVPPVTPIQPAAPPPASPTITLRAAPLSIDRGQATSLQWDAKYATSVRIEPELGDVQNQGSRAVNQSSSTTYTATATGTGRTASDSARITVRIPAPPPVERPQPRPTPAVSMDELFKQNVQVVYFDYDKADIRPDQVQRLQAGAAWLKTHPGLKFTIEGHCDDR